MPNDAYTQQALATDPRFIARVRSNLANVAWQILDEDPATPNHANRAKYASTVIINLQPQATMIAYWLVERPNLVQFETSYNFPAAAVVTAAGDPDIQSQLMSDWNMLAGGVAPPLSARKDE